MVTGGKIYSYLYKVECNLYHTLFDLNTFGEFHKKFNLDLAEENCA